MDERQLTNPYRLVCQPPADMTKLRRHLHPRYDFRPLPEAGHIVYTSTSTEQAPGIARSPGPFFMEPVTQIPNGEHDKRPRPKPTPSTTTGNLQDHTASCSFLRMIAREVVQILKERRRTKPR